MTGVKIKGLKTNLAAMAKEFGITFDEGKLHDATYDIDVNMRVFIQLVMKMEIECFDKIAEVKSA